MNNIETEKETDAGATEISGAALVLKVLAEHGVSKVFGYPGGTIMPVYDAFLDSSICHYLCRHEQGAAFAALGYARASGQTGVCIATSGPGATNLITGLADALSDSVPMVAITGQVATHLMGTDAFQEIDIFGMSLACTKHSFQVTDVNELASTLASAFAIATSGRPGPVLVDIPKDIQMAKVSPQSQVTDRESSSFADASKLSTAIDLLASAQRPILYVGGGANMARAIPQLRDFVAVTGIPTVETLKGLGSVDNRDPGYLGMLGMHGLKAANLAVQECDLLVAVGARFDDRVTGRLSTFAPNAKVIQLDIDGAEVGKLRPADVAILADLKQVLPALAMPLSLANWQKQCAELKQQHQFDYDAPTDAIYAPGLLKQLSQQLGAESVVTADVGQHQMWVAQHMLFAHPNNHLTSGGAGTMGFGLPAAIGAQLSRIEDTVVAVSGDGSFMMNVQELGTIKRFQLPIKIVLIDNSKLGMVRQWQQLFFEERYSETDLSDNPDFVALAAAFGIAGQCITKKAQVDAALSDMLNHDGPYMLHVKIDEMANVWPLVPPGAANQDMMERQP